MLDSPVGDTRNGRTDSVKPHPPVRTCVACGVKKYKANLVRVSIDSQGVMNIGATNNQKGRGVYLCPSYQCWNPDSYKNGLEKGLRVTMSNEIKNTLVNYLKDNIDSPLGEPI